MKIAIIGSGFYGSAAALVLSNQHSVDLFESKDDILQGASSANQYRFHLGYHYPRSQKTINEIQKTNKDFIRYFGNNFFGITNNYYGITKYGSKTSLNKYEKVLKKNNLNYTILKKNHLNSDNLSSIISVDEKILNYFKFKKYIKKKILNNNINLRLSTEFKNHMLIIMTKL